MGFNLFQSIGDAFNTVKNLGVNQVYDKAKPILQVITANAGNEQVLAVEILKLKEIPGLPASAMVLIDELAKPGNDVVRISGIVTMLSNLLNS